MLADVVPNCTNPSLADLSLSKPRQGTSVWTAVLSSISPTSSMVQMPLTI